jgi:hypothetical protein
MGCLKALSNYGGAKNINLFYFLIILNHPTNILVLKINFKK